MSYVPNILNSKEQFVNKSDTSIHLVKHTTEGWAEHKNLSKSLLLIQIMIYDTFIILFFYHFGVNNTLKCWALCTDKINLSTYHHLRNNISRKKLTICGKWIGGITVFNMAILVKENSTFSWNGQLPYWQRHCMCISSTDQ